MTSRRRGSRAAGRSAPTVLTVLAVLVLAGCGDGDPDSSGARPDDPSTATSTGVSTGTSTETSAGSPSSAPTSSGTTSASPSPAAHGRARVVRTLATGLSVPWGLALLPDGSLLVSTRDRGDLYRVGTGSGRRVLLGHVSEAVSNVGEGGEAGLLGVAVSPDFATDQRVYLYYSTADDNRIGWVSVARSGRPGRRLGPVHVILSGIPHGVHHDGGGLVFGPDGLLYAGTGESGDTSLAEDTSSLGGKVLRLTTRGEPAPHNPFPDSVVYSYGHRNVQGLVFDAAGRLWASEFGDHDKDELNLIRPGRDYGWPRTEGLTDLDGVTGPVAEFGTEEDSPSGVAIAGGSVWMAALAGERLWRIPLDDARLAAEPEAFLTGRYGRLRSVVALDDDTLVVGTSNHDGRGDPGAEDDRLLVVEVR